MAKKKKYSEKSLRSYCDQCNKEIRICAGRLGAPIIAHSPGELYCSMECFSEKKGDFMVVHSGKEFLEWLEVRTEPKDRKECED